MAGDAQYAEAICRMGRDELLALWEQIVAGNTPGWAAGKAFEYLVLRAFELDGAEVRYPFEVEVRGRVVEQIDGAVYAMGLSAIVESKDHAGEVDYGPIGKLRNQLLRRPAGTMGLMFSRTGFADSARILAQFCAPQMVLLWEGAEVEQALKDAGMVRGLWLKYRKAVETGIPDHRLEA